MRILWTVVAVILLALMMVVPVTAQDTLATNTPVPVATSAPEDTVETPVVLPDEDTAPLPAFDWVTVVLAAMVVGVTTIQTLTGRTLILSLTSVLPVLLNFASGLAAATPSKTDDDAVMTMGRALGYDLERNAGGVIIWHPRKAATPDGAP